jgi:hypothetical protein
MLFRRALAWLILFGACVVWDGVAGAQTVTLSPTTLASANVGTPFYQLLSASGGTAPYVYTPSIVYPAFSSPVVSSPPPGLMLTPGGILTGTPTAAGTYSFTVLACDSSAADLCGRTTYSLNVGAAATPSGTILWSPVGTEVTYNGLPIGAGVLNATTTNGGTVSYTWQYQPNGPGSATLGPAVTATAGSLLGAGSYVLTATNSVGGASATIHFTVLPQHEWIINAAGNVTALDPAGNVAFATLPGGGLGAAIGQNGVVWSANTSGTSLATFSSAGTAIQTGLSGGGLSAPTGIAIDGAGSVWVANGNASVSQFTNAGVPLSPAGGFTGGSLSAPTGIAVDQAGDVWVSNGGNNSITELIGAGTPVAPVTAAVTNATAGGKP